MATGREHTVLQIQESVAEPGGHTSTTTAAAAAAAGAAAAADTLAALPGQLPNAASAEGSPYEQPEVQQNATRDSSDNSAPVDGTVELHDALNELVDDIYAICVRYIVACYGEREKDLPNSFIDDKKKKIAWLICAAMFTFLLQFTLVILLWNAASYGNYPMLRPASDKLWQQVGAAHQLLCRWQQHNYNKGGERIFLPDIKDCDCHSWWPKDSEFVDVDYSTAKECLSRPKSAMTGDGQWQCNRTVFYLNSSWMAYGRGLFYNRTTLKDEDKDDNSTATDNNTAVNSTATHCTGVNNSTNVNLLLNSTGVNSTAANNSLCGTDADTEKRFIGERLDPVVRIDPVFFIMFAYVVLAIVVHQEFKQGVWLCYIAAGCVGILPKFFGQLSLRKGRSQQPAEWRIIDHDKAQKQMPFPLKLVVLLVPMLQVVCSIAVLATGGVLYLFEQNQNDAVFIIVNSVALAFILDVDNKIAAIISQRAEWKYPAPRKIDGKNPIYSTARALELEEQRQQEGQERRQAGQQGQPPASANRPWIQRLRSLLIGLLGLGHGRADIPHSNAADTKHSCWCCWCTSWHWRCPGWLTRFAGYAYMSLVGALIYAEVIFLAPQSVAQLLSFVVVVFTRVGHVDAGGFRGQPPAFGIAPAFRGNTVRPTIDWFAGGLWDNWSFGGILDGYFGSQKQVFSPLDQAHSDWWIITAYFCYWFVTVVFVVLLCVRIQPSCSRYYTHALVYTQLLLVSVALFQDGTWQVKCNTSPLVDGSIKDEPLKSQCPRNFWWLVVMATYFFFWAFMFVYVPANMGFPMWMCYIFSKCHSCIKGFW